MFFVDNDYENKTVNKNTYQIKQENNVFKFNKSTAIHQKHSVRLVNLIVDPYHSHAQENVQGTLWDAWKMVLKLGLTFLLGPNDWRSQIAWGKNGKKIRSNYFGCLIRDFMDTIIYWYIYILYVPLFWTCLACTVWNHDQLVRSQTGLVQGSKDWQAEIPWGFSALGGEITSGVMCVGYTPRPTRKTKMTMEHPPLQDVFPIGNGDLPMSC